MQVISKAFYKTSEKGDFPEESILDEDVKTESYAQNTGIQGSGRFDAYGNQYAGPRLYEIRLNGIKTRLFDDIRERYLDSQTLYWCLHLTTGEAWVIKSRITSMPARIRPADPATLSMEIVEGQIFSRYPLHDHTGQPLQ